MKIHPSTRGKRFKAAFIDLLFYGMLNIVFSFILIYAFGLEMLAISFLDLLETDTLSDALRQLLIISQIIALILGILYYVVVPFYADGQTVAKRIFGVKAVNYQKENPSFLQHLGRAIIIWNTLLTIPFLIYITQNYAFYIDITGSIATSIFIFILISFVLILSTSNQQGIHDLITKTYVIPLKVTISQPSNPDWADISDDQ